jgi:uncharacterized membrane protein (UPF0182 family)
MSDARGPKLPRGRGLLLGFLGVLATLLLLRWAVSLYVDHLWFAAQDATGVFWTRTFWEWGARLGAGVFTGVLVGLNLRPVAGTFRNLQIRRRFGDLVIAERLPAAWLRWGVIGAGLLTGFWFAAAIPAGTGLQLLLGLRGPEVGVLDPVLGSDLGFHLFRLPLLTGLLTWGMVAVLFASALVLAGYAGSNALRFDKGRVDVDPGAARHLAGLLATFLLLVSLRLLLSPYLLLADGTSPVQGIVGATDVGARIPGLRIMGFLAFVTAAAAAWGALRSRLLPGISGAAALALLSVVALQLYPAFVQRFQVQPNELVRETPHIERAVAATRAGFDLQDLGRDRLPYQAPSQENWEMAQLQLTRLPVWTRRTLEETFREVEARFRYYQFSGITFTRYPTPGLPGASTPVALGVREISPEFIPQQTWQNLHLREAFVTGLGVVAGPVNRQDPQGRMPTWIGAVPPEFRDGPEVPPELRLERPRIHVGAVRQRHSIVTPSEEDFRAPDGSPGEPGVDFPGGIRAGSLLRRAALAWYFADANILISGEVSADSRLVHRRDVRSRIQALAPFLHLPEEPYAVVHEGRVVWVVEGFTVSRRFPLSVSHALDVRSRANYVRNSVKITVDAVTGQTRLYMADASDPLLQGWDRAFPGLLRPLAELPEGLRAHLRYSRWLMEVQVQVLLRYHQESPAVFHAQRDPWAVPLEIPDASGAVRYRPEYALLSLPGSSEEGWVLSTVVVPEDRPNLAAFIAGRWTEDGGEVFLWDAPQEDQVAGPPMIATLVEQDAAISEQFSLWRRGGSDVSTGHLHVVPVGNTLLYMSPVFLAAANTPIPEIRRYIVSDGRSVAMEPTLAAAIRVLQGRGEATPPRADADPLPGEAPEVREPGELEPLDRPAPLPATGPLSARALEFLDAAEAALRAGDWAAFGRNLEALRELLRREGAVADPQGSGSGTR